MVRVAMLEDIVSSVIEYSDDEHDGPAGEILIRPATARDGLGIVRIAARDRTPQEAVALATIARTWEAGLFADGDPKRSLCLVAATGDGHLLGVALAVVAQSHLALVEVLVEEKHRRQGVGQRLLAELTMSADARLLPVVACVRVSDVYGIGWLARREFCPGKRPDGSEAISDARDSVFLVRPGRSGAKVVIAS